MYRFAATFLLLGSMVFIRNSSYSSSFTQVLLFPLNFFAFFFATFTTTSQNIVIYSILSLVLLMLACGLVYLVNNGKILILTVPLLSILLFYTYETGFNAYNLQSQITKYNELKQNLSLSIVNTIPGNDLRLLEQDKEFYQPNKYNYYLTKIDNLANNNDEYRLDIDYVNRDVDDKPQAFGSLTLRINKLDEKIILIENDPYLTSDASEAKVSGESIMIRVEKPEIEDIRKYRLKDQSIHLKLFDSSINIDCVGFRAGSCQPLAAIDKTFQIN